MNIESVISEYGTYIYNFALKLSAHPKDAEDLTQETFIKAWKHLDTLENEDAIKQWLRTICLNEFRMKYKKEHRIEIKYMENIEDLKRDGRLLSTPTPTPIDEVAASEEVAKLRNGCFLAMTRKLTLNQRLTFSLIDMFGLSIQEVAKLLDISPKAIKGLLYRARMNLEFFFYNHCSILDPNNSCQCLAWKDFVEQRSDLQKSVQQKLTFLDYKNSEYTFDKEIRNKLLYYYKNMPEQRPSDEWFTTIIQLLEKMYKNT